jgi:hypothetical protein
MFLFVCHVIINIHVRDVLSQVFRVKQIVFLPI